MIIGIPKGTIILTTTHMVVGWGVGIGVRVRQSEFFPALVLCLRARP